MPTKSRKASQSLYRRKEPVRRGAPKRGAARQKIDPVLTEIVRNGVIAVTEEMKTNLMRTAYNMIIYEALDFTTGLFTADGDTVSIGIGLPSFTRGMSNTVKSKIAHFGKKNMKPGDIYVTNDAYTTGSHLNHFTFTLPIFHRGTLAGFSCCMAHWIDVGGQLGGMTTDIYAEGLQIPIVKYQDRGVVNQTLVDIIRLNVRLPSRAMGDLRAQVTAVKTGERRFLQLLDRYGQKPVLAAIKGIMDQAEAQARARTLTIPDGVYEAESFMDDDGIDIGKPVPIRVKVIVKGDEVTVDLTDISKQVRGFFNSGPSTSLGCAQMAHKCITSPTDYPINDGSFRNLKVIVPQGTIVSAVRPAPMRWWMTYPMTLVDTIYKALQPAIPERVIAGHHADLVTSTIHGINPRTREFFIGGLGPLGGGWGGKMTEDGVSATVCANDGDTHNSPNEQVEAKFPVVVERCALIQDSGGAGRYRGGLGIESVVRARSPLTLNTQTDRAHCRPWGLDGGLDASGNQIHLRREGNWKTDQPNAKMLITPLKAGDAFRLRSGGGGGYGSPLERDSSAVGEDVRQGYVSVDAARNQYGVVIDPETFEVDAAATEQLRSAMRSGETAAQRSAYSA
ncbi:MAG TPA: hydantoinase B/oxoprolinase family protein [Xanthobacteraceae bacterium]|nr:hydantoinase B/oxoprolinase family protein [Xanthobacteraceae bacterium]